MKIQVPIILPEPKQLPLFRALDHETQVALGTLMESIFTGDLEPKRTEFVFRNNVLMGQFDVSRGEIGYMLEHHLDKVLLTRRFFPDDASGLEIPDILPDIHPGKRGAFATTYRKGRMMVIVALEVADRGKHKYFDIRFGLMARSYGDN
jgi:hypothetical protein